MTGEDQSTFSSHRVDLDDLTVEFDPYCVRVYNDLRFVGRPDPVSDNPAGAFRGVSRAVVDNRLQG